MVKKKQQLTAIKLLIQHNYKQIRLYDEKTKKILLKKNPSCYIKNKNLSLILTKNKYLIKQLILNDI